MGSFKFEGCFCSRKLLADINWECLTLLITVVNFDESFVCSKLSRLTRLLFSVQPIRMSHWCHTMVDGAKFWITCKWLELLRKAGCLQLIRNTTPSTIVWCQCDIWIIARLAYLPANGSSMFNNEPSVLTKQTTLFKIKSCLIIMERYIKNQYILRVVNIKASWVLFSNFVAHSAKLHFNIVAFIDV